MKPLLTLALLGCAALAAIAGSAQASLWLLCAALAALPPLVLMHEIAHWAVGRWHGLQGRLEWTASGRLKPRYRASAQPGLSARVRARVLMAGPIADALGLLIAALAVLLLTPGPWVDLALGCALSAALMFASNAQPQGDTDGGQLQRLQRVAADALDCRLLNVAVTLLVLLALSGASLALARQFWPHSFGGVA
ncbi:MAG: hypothetical protein ACOVKS_15215 [Aquimonas sp.]